jgi:hypothetical protein
MAAKDVAILERHFCLVDTTAGTPKSDDIFAELKKRLSSKKYDFIYSQWLIYKDKTVDNLLNKNYN